VRLSTVLLSCVYGNLLRTLAGTVGLCSHSDDDYFFPGHPIVPLYRIGWRRSLAMVDVDQHIGILLNHASRY
jgi:hypothetical protein